MMKKYHVTEDLTICDRGVILEPRFTQTIDENCVGKIELKKGMVVLAPTRFQLGQYLLSIDKLEEVT